ncbi:DUF4870 domain-containing protein [Phycisphaera mikurensis]|uniref:DUF4870 domain-containing protein n=1 Tax=Phycisphaera mikurensis (strain NBRC 102666 / KCTC 22515 / FYK2301M01) TaxID=1142394 RepID=I0IAI5_PHYMF|nr:DUF4870 domain-containing protein [Phycisphaera mikurensis]MBB6441730.1 hypothetical protein [Phycisphaera mikurensis]BAM02273.1 hypothetical protein PSMK_01140 [Phycisphaera mikurensis NBRC 102666]
MDSHDSHPPTPDAPHADPDAGTPALTADDTNLGMLAHLLGAFTGFVGPLIIWAVKKDQSVFIATESREALNFQITIVLGFLVLGVATCLTFGLAGVLFPLLLIYSLVFSIIAALKAKDGVPYRYPLTIRLVK